MNADLVTISEWAHQWFVTFNTQKTVALHFSLKKKKKSSPVLVFNGSLIKQKNEHKHNYWHYSFCRSTMVQTCL